MSLSVGFDIGLRSLLSSQTALQTLGNNVANANTPGYVRRQVILAESSPILMGGFAFGTGVDVAQIRRVVDEALEARLRDAKSSLARLGTERAGMQQLESIFAGAGGSGLQSLVSDLFASLSSATAQPDDSIGRREIVTSGDGLAAALREMSVRLGAFRRDAVDDLRMRIEEVNRLTTQIAAINRQIVDSKGQGSEPATLLDTRGQLVSQLSELAKVTTIEDGDGSLRVLLSGLTLVSGKKSFDLSVTTDTGGSPVLKVQGGVGSLPLDDGALAGLFNLSESAAPELAAKTDAFVHSLIAAFNHTHATGVPAGGGFTSLLSEHAASDPTLPLSAAGLPFEVSSGALYVTLENATTGAIEKTKIDVDPSGSLNDLATQLAGVAHLTATVDPAGRLRIGAEAGWRFDFSPRLDANPAGPGGFGGTSPTVSGTYSGTKEDAWTFKPDADGTIGVTPGLTIGVFDGAGARIATLDVGAGYSAGTKLAVKDGVEISFGSGSVVAATDSFSLDVVADSDRAGVLTALGLNSFFSGSTASDIAVRSDLLADPDKLAGSLTGAAGDGGNLNKLLALQSADQDDLGGATLGESVTSILAGLGSDTKRAGDLETAASGLVDDLSRQREEVSGVSLEEEMANLVRFRQAYDAAGQYIRVIRDVSDSLLSILQ